MPADSWPPTREQLTSWAITVADALHPVFLRQYDGSELDAAIDMDTESLAAAVSRVMVYRDHHPCPSCDAKTALSAPTSLRRSLWRCARR
jgi:hypothetical protein